MTVDTKNSDLAKARALCPFPVEPLTNFLDGSQEQTVRRHEIEALVENDPVFSNESKYFMSRNERYHSALRKSRRYVDLKINLKLSEDDDALLNHAINDSLPTMLHPLMFVPNIEILCTEEQKAKWLPLCEKYEVIGCYAQTELGHGSNIRALETTATYIPETDEFEINSPTLTSTKWWPGTLGRTANHAMVIGQLITNGKNFGIHNFIVPIRDIRTHELLPGIVAGDLGPKLGYNPMDNGFCQFSKVRIPRANMAAKYSSVDRNGNYLKHANVDNRVAYITMMQVRTYIVHSAGFNLAKACTISIRYSLIRRQGFRSSTVDQSDEHKEHQVLDYTIQAYRIVPMLATSYAFHCAGRVMKKRLSALESILKSGDTSKVGQTMAEFHASSSGLKSLCTSIAGEGIEDCRKACGGHGYLLSSGLPMLLGDYMQNCTVEGENHMLTQQTVRYLLKAVPGSSKGETGGEDTSYLVNFHSNARCTAASQEEMMIFSVLVDAYKHRAARLVYSISGCMKLGLSKKNNKPLEEIWNSLLVEVVRASRAHSLLLVFQMFNFEVESSTIVLPAEAKKYLQKLIILFALYWIERDMGDFTEDGYMNLEQASWVREATVQLLGELRPGLIGLVDAWDFSDHQLGSALGRKDGDVYNALMENAMKSTLNSDDCIMPFSKL